VQFTSSGQPGEAGTDDSYVNRPVHGWRRYRRCARRRVLRSTSAAGLGLFGAQRWARGPSYVRRGIRSLSYASAGCSGQGDRRDRGVDALLAPGMIRQNRD
jgi:hypothetical protein